MRNIDILATDIVVMLNALRTPYKQVSLGHNYPNVFVIMELGAVIVGIDPADYSYMLTKLITQFPKHRYIFISVDDIMHEKKEEVIWELMRSGYIRYIRLKHTRQFNSLIQAGFGRKIIAERLKVWGDDPKHKFLVEENKRALDMPGPHLLNVDPAFFDFMPEKPIGEDNV